MTTPNALKERGLLSTGEVAALAGVHRSTVWHHIKTGMLEHEKVGKRYVGVSREALKKSSLVDSFRGSKTAKPRQSGSAKTVSRKRK